MIITGYKIELAKVWYNTYVDNRKHEDGKRIKRQDN